MLGNKSEARATSCVRANLNCIQAEKSKQKLKPPCSLFGTNFSNNRPATFAITRPANFNKVAGLRPATLLKQRLWHMCFPVNFAKFLRTPFFIEHVGATASSLIL